MLFGEHSVLRGGTSLVAAVEPRLTVSLTPIPEDAFTIHSHLGTASTSIHSISLGNSFRFVEKALLLFQDRFSQGANIVIESEINPQVGLGSSAAVTVATLACLMKWLEGQLDPYDLLSKARDVITKVQGHGSAADAASIIWGGVIKYSMDPVSVKTLCQKLPLTLVYSGKKTPTSQVIAYVNKQEKAFPQIFASIFAAIEEVAKEATEAVEKQNWEKLGALMNVHNGLQEALLVGTQELASISWELKASHGILGAKISGSGLGDSVIGLGRLEPQDSLYNKQIPISVASRGVYLK
jgi:mevalonate kinase